jgi:hypothetical protein
MANFFWLTHHYQRLCPTQLDQDSGKIYPLNEHGRVVYLTLAEHHKIQAATLVFAVVWICGFAIGLREIYARLKGD